ncbi:hypothetical protein [Alteromonas antoniana]|uniref:hypothetical protein n=1 Tax=Alteromonas antoniana TaxID=2803813 RepID=UPI001C45D6BF|nr:hypothetical protein [Alteromonas antoniana]
MKMYYGMSDFSAKLENETYDGALYVSYRLLLNELDAPLDFIYAPYKRTQRLLTEAEPACTFYALKTAPREQAHYFSLPLTFLSTPRLYIRGDKPLDDDLLNENGELKSLEAFFDAKPDALMLLIDGVSYGDALDSRLAALSERNIVKRASGDRHNKLSGMFFRDRVDIALIYPQEVKQHLALNPEDTEPFQSYVIAGVPATTSGYIMCNQYPQTEALIARVNQALMRLYDTTAFIEGQLRHSPGSEFPVLEAAILEAKQLSAKE